jgi:hypothetical protein
LVHAFKLFQTDFREEEDGDEDADAVRDLSDLPPEVALSVLSHLNATDLCLAACVWQQLASDEILWDSKLTYASGYNDSICKRIDVLN